jgi:hypothetical protein
VPVFWTNEYEVPQELLALLKEPELPEVLRNLIIKAKWEADNQGAVTYPTKSNIESSMHEYKDLLKKLWGNNNKE